MIKPIRIASTKEFLAVYVNLDRLLNGSYMRYCLVQDWVNFLKFLTVQRLKPNLALIVSWKDTVDGQYLKRMYFQKTQSAAGLSGWMVARSVCPVRHDSSRAHLAMSGYLQNGEAICMKKATLLWHDKLKDHDAKLVNFVHDEWQVECPNNMTTALMIAQRMAYSLTTSRRRT